MKKTRLIAGLFVTALLTLGLVLPAVAGARGVEDADQGGDYAAHPTESRHLFHV
jgi:hypothetical protein